jgi:hypothetical protein
MRTRRTVLVILSVIGLGLALVPVSRAQYLCSGLVFGDVSSTSVGDAFCGYIEHFAALGITGGCNVTPPLYCPDNYVTRAQMAVFLTSALDTVSRPRTQFFSVGGEGFAPGSTVNYFNTYACGGAYITSGVGALVAPVHLPQGAVVTEFKVFFNDTSANDMSVSLQAHNLSSCGYAGIAGVTSSGTGGYYSVSVTPSENVIDNTQFSYHIYAYSDVWDSNLKIKGAVITYTAP